MDEQTAAQAVNYSTLYISGATILAIIIGPILAVIVTRYIDNWRAKKERRMVIFRDLMRTRASKLDAAHVGALNLIDVEFHGDADVINAYRRYLEHLRTPTPPAHAQMAFFRDREDRFLELLHAIGGRLQYRLDKLELGQLGYAPDVWADTQIVQIRNAHYLCEVFQGLRPLPIVYHTAGLGAFPPPPSGPGAGSPPQGSRGGGGP